MKKTVFALTVLCCFLAGCAETDQQKEAGKAKRQGYKGLPVELQVQDDRAIPVKVEAIDKEGIPVKVQWQGGEGKPVKVELSSDQTLPVKIQPDRTTRAALIFSVLAVVAAAVAAFGAWRSAYNTRLAVEELKRLSSNSAFRH